MVKRRFESQLKTRDSKDEEDRTVKAWEKGGGGTLSSPPEGLESQNVQDHIWSFISIPLEALRVRQESPGRFEMYTGRGEVRRDGACRAEGGKAKRGGESSSVPVSLLYSPSVWTEGKKTRRKEGGLKETAGMEVWELNCSWEEIRLRREVST